VEAWEEPAVEKAFTPVEPRGELMARWTRALRRLL
jgi:hypothetical protein